MTTFSCILLGRPSYSTKEEKCHKLMKLIKFIILLCKLVIHFVSCELTKVVNSLYSSIIGSSHSSLICTSNSFTGECLEVLHLFSYQSKLICCWCLYSRCLHTSKPVHDANEANYQGHMFWLKDLPGLFTEH